MKSPEGGLAPVRQVPSIEFEGDIRYFIREFTRSGRLEVEITDWSSRGEAYPVDYGTEGWAFYAQTFPRSTDGGTMTYLGEPIHSIGHRNNTSKHEVAQRGTAVYFLDRNTGWIADNEQHVWSTVDVGSNWSDLGKIAADRISDGDWIMFTDRINGWFMTRSGDLWMTNNAGTSWSQVYQSDDPRNPVLGAEATSFALEIGWMGMTEGYLSRTIDNGRTRKSAKVFGECAVSAIDQISDGSSIAFCAERSQILIDNLTLSCPQIFQKDCLTLY